MGNGLLGYVMGGFIGLVGGALVMGKAMEVSRSPQEVIINVDDLNCDGVDDLVIKAHNEHKVPMYGVIENGKISYFASREMKERNPKTTIDYEAIEYNLNH